MADGAPLDEPALPALDCDVLRGVERIALWFGWSHAECRGMIDGGYLPTYRVPGKRDVFAFKSDLINALREYQQIPGAAAKAAPRNPSGKRKSAQTAT